MDTVEGGESGRIGDKPAVDNAVSDCKSPITADAPTDHESDEFKFEASRCQRVSGGRCTRGKEQQIGTGWGDWVSSDVPREERGAGCHHLLATCTPHSSHINLSRAQQCKAAFRQAKRALASYRNVQLMWHTDPSHTFSVYTVARWIKIKHKGWTWRLIWEKCEKVSWIPFLQWGIVILMGCCKFSYQLASA